MVDLDNSGDIDGYIALFDPGVSFEMRPFFVDIDRLRETAETFHILGERWELGECTKADANVTCSITAADDFTEAVGLPMSRASITFEQRSGTIVAYRELWQLDFYYDAMEGFVDWVTVSVPDAPYFLNFAGAEPIYHLSPMMITAEEARLMRDVVGEYVAALEDT